MGKLIRKKGLGSIRFRVHRVRIGFRKTRTLYGSVYMIKNIV